MLARNPFLGPESKLSLVTLAELTSDEGLRTLLATQDYPAIRELARRSGEAVTAAARDPVLLCLPEHPPPQAVSGYTVRRAVARIGRNDPCPCGSGKKYKRCCFDKDQVRLAQSSAVAGLTVAELRSQRERYLTAEEVQQMRSYELIRLDPAKVAPDLLPILVNRLLLFNETERVVRLFELTGVVAPIAGHWDDALQHAATRHQPDLVRRLLRLRPDFDPTAAEVDLEVRLALLESTANPTLDLIEAEALASLRRTARPDALVTLGYALLDSRYPALGILVARGVLPIATPLDSETLHGVLLETRDRLNLDFRDPIDPVVEQYLDERAEHAAEDSAALVHARRNIEEKNLEVRRLRRELERLNRDLQKRTETPPTPPPIPAQAPPPEPPSAPPPPKPTAADDPTARDLRQRIEALKADLNVRHTERNQLRRDLQKVTQELEAVRAQASRLAQTPPPEPPDDEGVSFQEVEFDSNQPIRVPEYSKRFSEALLGVPKPVARTTMVLIGRLAAGQPAAFTGLKKLEANPQVLRQRVGADHRLLFRLTPQALQVLALVNRRELDRQIRNLFAP
jgi:hypothetical protein